jgi:hypothetical protein
MYGRDLVPLSTIDDTDIISQIGGSNWAIITVDDAESRSETYALSTAVPTIGSVSKGGLYRAWSDKPASPYIRYPFRNALI